MTVSDRRARLGDWLWFFTWAVASSIWCVTAATQLSATFDEPLYVEKGLEHWRTGSYHGLLRLGTMPLPVDVETLPLYAWERWRGEPFDSVEDFGQLLPWARGMTLIFWWLLLFYGRLAGRALAGPWGGRLAVALLACEPSFLAHAGLATTDIAVSACLLALVYHFRKGRDAGWFRRFGVPGFWFAAAVLAKASALVYGPLCLFAVELERLARAGAFSHWTADDWRGRLRQIVAAFRPWTRDLRWVIGGGLAGMAVYCGSDWQPQAAFIDWAQTLPHNFIGRNLVWLSQHLCIFSNGFEGLIQQVKHNVRGHGAYLLGYTDARALWWYFPALLSIKLSVPLLLLPLAVAVIRPRALLNWALLAAALVVVVSPAFRVQIGIRLLLPIVALAVVGLAGALVQTMRSARPWPRRVLVGICTVGIAWTAGNALAVWPDGVRYVNEIWGGPAAGYDEVSEANYDWGQGLFELERWRQDHGLADLDVWYFGSDPRAKELPMRNLELQNLPLHDSADVLELVRGRYVAVSTTLLFGRMRGDRGAYDVAIAAFHGRRPVARTSTFFIFDFTQQP